MTYPYGLRGAPAVGLGVAGLPMRQLVDAGSSSNQAEILFSDSPPSSGEWVALDGGVWDDRLDGTAIVGGLGFADEPHTVLPENPAAQIAWCPDNTTFVSYLYATKTLSVYRLDNDVDEFIQIRSFNLDDMPVTTSPNSLGVIIRHDIKQIALPTHSDFGFRIYDIEGDWDAINFNTQLSRPASLPNAIAVASAFYSHDSLEFLVAASNLPSNISFVSVDVGSFVATPVYVSGLAYFEAWEGNLLLSLDGRYAYRTYSVSSYYGSGACICRFRRQAKGVYVLDGVTPYGGQYARGIYALSHSGEWLYSYSAPWNSGSGFYSVFLTKIKAGDSWDGVWGTTYTYGTPYSSPNLIWFDQRASIILGTYGSLSVSELAESRFTQFRNVQFISRITSNDGKYSITTATIGGVPSIRIVKRLKPDLTTSIYKAYAKVV